MGFFFFSVQGASHFGRPIQIKSESKPRYATKMIGDIPLIFEPSVENYLYKLGFIHVWALHQLNEINLTQRISICNLFAKTGRKLSLFEETGGRERKMDRL